MNPEFKRYLSDLEAALSRLAPEQRNDALREIEAHFADASDAGAQPADVIARLGSPRLLAAALTAESLDQRRESLTTKAWQIIAGSVFITGTSFASVMVVPLLAVITVGFGLIAVFSPIAGVLRTFGATWISIDVGPGRSLPIEWSIPFMLVLAAVCAAIAFAAYKLLRLYLRMVARGYRSVLTRGLGAVSAAR